MGFVNDGILRAEKTAQDDVKSLACLKAYLDAGEIECRLRALADSLGPAALPYLERIRLYIYDLAATVDTEWNEP